MPIAWRLRIITEKGKNMASNTLMSHPGVMLKEELEERDLSIQGLARALRVPATRIHAIVHGKRGISADTSARLGRYFGASPEFWLRLQTQYDLRTLDQKKIEAEVIPAA